MELLVIDEQYVCALISYNFNIGDLLQLPPVIRDEEWRTTQLLKILFHSHVVQQSPPLYIELSTIFRQTDTEFISVSIMRDNKITANDVWLLICFLTLT
jgi:hypothetical protein